MERFFDAKSYSVLRWVLGGFLAGSAIACLVLASEGHKLAAAAAGANLLLVTVVLLLRRTALFQARFRSVLLTYLIGQFAALQMWSADREFKIVLAAALFPLLLTFFRLRNLEYLFLLLVSVGTAVWQISETSSSGSGSLAGEIVGVVLPGIVLFAVAVTVTRRQRLTFLAELRRQVSRERERVRMRDELHDARKIQLGMLPVSEPQLGWVDLASSSLPASEVGGDYFDYFPLSDERLAIVIGDVAGHGMGSGLVLAGIRSGLYLLREELDTPAEVATKLNRMMQEAVRWRMFVTLLVAVLDFEENRLRVVSAGHPPLLHYSAAGGEVHEVGRGAPPLGTRLPVRFEEESHPLGAGDVLLLYTDGLPEVSDLNGRSYGDTRLRRELRRAVGASSAQAVRDLLLEDVSRFKSDTAQRDDLTLVVAKIRGSER